MPQRMRGCRLCNASFSDRALDCLLDCRCFNVIAALLFGLGIDPPFCLGKNKLPAPFRGGVWILAVQSAGQSDATIASRQTQGVNPLHALEMLAQRGLHPFRQHGASIFVTLALANEQLAATRK